jgi:hypothetical protein
MIIEFLISQLWLGNIHLSWDAVINRIRLGGLICSLKSFLQLDMCQELDFCSCIYVLGCKLSLVRHCDSDFGITPIDDITIGIICAAFCFHIAHISFATSWYLYYYYYYYYYHHHHHHHHHLALSDYQAEQQRRKLQA